jgi:hypothetical protein
LPEHLEVSLWLDTYQENAAFPLLVIESWDLQKNLIKKEEFNPKTSMDIYENTVRVKAELHLDAAVDSMRISVQGMEIAPGTFLMREASVNVKAISNKRVFWNNYPLE